MKRTLVLLAASAVVLAGASSAQASTAARGPRSCRTALNLADRGFRDMGHALDGSLSVEAVIARMDARLSRIESSSRRCRGDYRTPQVCLDALDLAADGFTLAGLALEAIDAADVDSADFYIGEMDPDAYGAAKTECRYG